MPPTGRFDQLRRQMLTFSLGDQPADHAATENIQHDIQAVSLSFGGTPQFGDVPRPHLIGRGGQKHGPGMVLMA